MRLSVRGDYALRALMVLGENFDNGIVRIQTISDKQGIPKRFLEQILNDLRAGGFVESRRGVAGGYRIARPPNEITLASVIRHVEGPLAPLPVAEAHGSRRPEHMDEVQLAIRSVIKEVQTAIVAILNRLTIDDLCERAHRLRRDRAGVVDYAI